MMKVTIQVTSTLHVMKQWNPHFPFLMAFTGQESVNSLSSLFRMGGVGKCKKVLCFPQHFLTFNLILFLHIFFKMLGPYLAPISNYWSWTKTTPQKNRFYWSNGGVMDRNYYVRTFRTPFRYNKISFTINYYLFLYLYLFLLRMTHVLLKLLCS